MHQPLISRKGWPSQRLVREGQSILASLNLTLLSFQVRSPTQHSGGPLETAAAVSVSTAVPSLALIPVAAVS